MKSALRGSQTSLFAMKSALQNLQVNSGFATKSAHQVSHRAALPVPACVCVCVCVSVCVSPCFQGIHTLFLNSTLVLFGQQGVHRSAANEDSLTVG